MDQMNRVYTLLERWNRRWISLFVGNLFRPNENYFVLLAQTPTNERSKKTNKFCSSLNIPLRGLWKEYNRERERDRSRMTSTNH